MSGRTFAVALDPDQFASVFGSAPERTTGRTKSCKVCGDWHSLDYIGEGVIVVRGRTRRSATPVASA